MRCRLIIFLILNSGSHFDCKLLVEGLVVLFRIFSSGIAIFFCRAEPQGGTLIFVYIGRLGPLFWNANFEFQFQCFLWVFKKKNEYFLGYEDFVDIFGCHHKIRLYLGVISMYFGVFS